MNSEIERAIVGVLKQYKETVSQFDTSTEFGDCNDQYYSDAINNLFKVAKLPEDLDEVASSPILTWIWNEKNLKTD